MRQWTVDAFAAGPFKGNPACVVEPFDAWPETAWMQALAAENNQAETAFLLRTPDPARFGLRWMTPAIEVPLCGHATLASAHVLFEELGLAAERIAFETTQSGDLSVVRAAPRLEMDFPATMPTRVEIPEGLADALGATPSEAWLGPYLLALFEDEATVRSLKPDFAAIERVGSANGARGNVGVAAPAAPGADHDVVDRFFAPGSGVAEDPATGSLHCLFGPLFASRLGRPVVRFHQAYPGRGGDIETEVRGERVLLRGGAVTVAESRLRL